MRRHCQAVDQCSLRKEGPAQRGKEGLPQQFLVRSTLFSFPRPSHLEILVLSIYFLKCLILPDKTTLGHELNITFL